MHENYRTVAGEAKTEVIIHRSRFIGHCLPIQTEEGAQAHLERIRKQYWDATHNCFAYVVGEHGQTVRFSDDGEPGGTAGMPMLEVLKKRGLRDVLAVATRYFGGVLLGAGGLVRAYTRTAGEAVNAAGCLTMLWSVYMECTVEYPLWGKIERFLHQGVCVLHGVEFADQVRAAILVPSDLAGAFEKNLIDLSEGRVSPRRLREGYAPFDQK